jgi:peptidoglycan/xylan/chitin deacetylase (PgdA/CDA1 family)
VKPLLLVLILLVPPSPAGAPVEDVPIAITIDDLPWIGPPRGDLSLAATDRLLEALSARGVEATGFVNCDRAEERDPILQRWLDAGMPLGNHSAGHKDLNSADLAEWTEDVRRCDRYLRGITAEPVRSFRFPFLHQGPTVARRRAAVVLLDELGYVNAHVTIDTSDYLMAVAYREALAKGDLAEADRVGRAYVEHLVAAARHYRDFARERFGRDVSHVILVHANALNADWLGASLDALAAEGFRFVPLEEALGDPVYALPDDYVGGKGISWLYRVEPAMPAAAEWDQAREDEIRQRFGVR